MLYVEEMSWLFLKQLLTKIGCIQASAGVGPSSDWEEFCKGFSYLSEAT